MNTYTHKPPRLVVLLDINSFVDGAYLIGFSPFLGIFELFEGILDVKTSGTKKAPKLQVRCRIQYGDGGGLTREWYHRGYREPRLFRAYTNLSLRRAS